MLFGYHPGVTVYNYVTTPRISHPAKECFLANTPVHVVDTQLRYEGKPDQNLTNLVRH
jgi:hypothetical protein